jgi:hypothetical protein
MMGAARSRLASLEAEFLRSLSSGGPFAAGSDRRGMQATAKLLWAKRVRRMGKAWPELAALLGTRLAERAAEVLAGTPLPQGDHALQDGLVLARHLEAAGSIPDSLRLKLLTVRLHHRWHLSQLVRRSGPAAGCTYLRQSRRFVCALRLPGLHPLTISFLVHGEERLRGPRDRR